MKKYFKIIAIIMLLMSLILFVSCESKIHNEDEKENTDISDNGENGDDIDDNTDDENKDEITIDSVCTIEDALKVNWYCISEYTITEVKVGRFHDYGSEYTEENLDYITEEEFSKVLLENEYTGRVPLNWNNSMGKYTPKVLPESVTSHVTPEEYAAKYNFKVGQKVLDCHRNKFNMFGRLVFEDPALLRVYRTDTDIPVEIYDTCDTQEEIREKVNELGIFIGYYYYAHGNGNKCELLYYDGSDYSFFNDAGDSPIILVSERAIIGSYDELYPYWIYLTLTKNDNNE